MRAFLILILLQLSATVAMSQTTDEKAIREIIDNLWNGMQKGDSAMVHKSFADDPTFASIYRTKTDGPVLSRSETLSQFLNAVGSAHKETWFEETWDYKTDVNGDFATVWCSYAFYLDNSFSHCGVDAFHLHKDERGWKIFHLADTRQRLQCVIPDHIQKKHK
jgi:hypothetical protein